MTQTWLIYHPKRQKTVIGDLTIHHDKFDSNQDPYIWQHNFLHTFCHITQLTNVPGQINFWVADDSYPNFTRLFCDCVFVIDGKHFWTKPNCIERSDKIIDSDQAFEHHYNWVNRGQHHFKKRRRYTLKADGEKSFQPQDNLGNLIDILPFLNKHGISTDMLIRSMTSKRGSRPMQLDSDLGQELYNYLFSQASVKLFGSQLQNIHPNRQQADKTQVPNNDSGNKKVCC